MLMDGKNIGDLLNAEHISWGSFMGGFDLTLKNDNGTTGCGRSTFSSNVNGTIVDYIPHHAWFQYYKSTANPTHARRPHTIMTPAAMPDAGQNTATSEGADRNASPSRAARK